MTVSNYNRTPKWINGKPETTITLMSLFKNYRKNILRTEYFPNAYPITDILDSLAGAYMGLPGANYDFSSIGAGLTMQKFRINDVPLADAMSYLAEVARSYLYWHKGVLKSALLTPAGDPDEYDFGRISEWNETGANELDWVETLTVKGRELTKEDGTEDVTVGTFVIKQEDFWQVWDDKWYFYINLEKQPADKLAVTADDATYTYAVQGIEGNKIKILATRAIPDVEPAGDVTVTVKGRLYKVGQLEATIQNPPLVGSMSCTEETYENPFIQSVAIAENVGWDRLFYRALRHGIVFTAPHNGDLYVGKRLKFTNTPAGFDTSTEIMIKNIQSTWQVTDHKMEDVITGLRVL